MGEYARNRRNPGGALSAAVAAAAVPLMVPQLFMLLMRLKIKLSLSVLWARDLSLAYSNPTKR